MDLREIILYEFGIMRYNNDIINERKKKITEKKEKQNSKWRGRYAGTAETQKNFRIAS